MIKYNIDVSKYFDSIGRVNIAITSKQWFKESEDYKNILKETEWVNTLKPEFKIVDRIKLPKPNTIYEVKSEYTLNADLDKNELKFQAVKDAGYNFILKIY